MIRSYESFFGLWIGKWMGIGEIDVCVDGGCGGVGVGLLCAPCVCLGPRGVEGE